jgi:hypothetical protein
VNEITITQIDSGGGQTWATGINGNKLKIFALQNGTWIRMDGGLAHVTVGESGVWGVNRVNSIYVRRGVAPDTPYGTAWRRLRGGLQQIDAGSSGVVCGVIRYLFFTSI